MTSLAPTLEIEWQASIPAEVMAKIEKLPRWRTKLLFSDPTRHESPTELFRDACTLHRAGLGDSECEEVLTLKFASYYRDMTPREIERAVENSRDDALAGKSGPQYPPKNADLIAKIAASNEEGLAELKSLSPMPNPSDLETGAVIDLLFPSGGLLCLASAKERSVTMPRSEFAGLEHLRQFMVPNRMSSEMGLNQAGRLSRRANANVGNQVYQVIEFDNGSLEEQARIHLHLKSCGIPLVMVVFSGGKSLHGWFRINRIGGANFSKFLYYAAALGADKATFVPCQLVRTPNATRDGGEKQEVLYLDPRAGL